MKALLIILGVVAVLGVGLAIWLKVDLNRAKRGKRSLFWRREHEKRFWI